MKYPRPRIMEDGTIAYPKKGAEPPPPIEGYRRKSDNPRSPDAWIFIPEWPECQHRDIQTTIRSCGSVQVTATCKLKGVVVKKPACMSCTERAP